MNSEISDEELIYLVKENDENVKNLIFNKYKNLIDIYVKKYSRLINIFNVDEQDLRAEALLGFSDGINSYDSTKDAGLSTFLSICIQRRITKFIDKHARKKYQLLNDTISLDYVKDDSDTALIDMISDNNKNNPLDNLETLETIDEIIKEAKNNLSDSEYQVFTLMINGNDYMQIAKTLDKSPKQIDNTIQRVKAKMRKIINGGKL